MKINYLGPLLSLWAILLAGPALAAIDRDKSTRYYEEALEHFRAESFIESSIQLRNALQQDPNNLPARIMLGQVLLRQNQPQAAIKELEKAQAMGGDENLILIPLAVAYMELARPEQVITAIVSDGHNPEVDGELKLLQAEAYLQLGDKKRAEELYLAAGTLMPVDPRPIVGRAKIQLSKGKTERAFKLVEESVMLAPTSFPAWLFKATIHRDHQQYAEAIKAFETALELDPTSGRALTARAAMWMDLGRSAEARRDLEQVKNLESDTLETIYLRTLLLFRDGKAEEAREVLRTSGDEIKQISEDFREKLPNTKLMLGVVAFFEGNYDAARSNLRGYLASFPGHLGAKRYLAATYLALGDHAGVVRLYKPSPSAQVPGDPMGMSLLAEAYRALDEHKKAEQYLEAAIALAPDVAGIGVRLAASRFDAGKSSEAIADLEKLTERFPELQEAWMQLVRIHTKSGNKERAVAALKAMLERFGEDAGSHNLAGATYLAVGDTLAASTHLRLAAELDPEALLPRINLARLAKLQNEYATAESTYRSILESFPNSPEANLELAALLADQGEISEAMDRIQTVLRRDPMSFRAHELKLRLIDRHVEDPKRIRAAIYELTKSFAEEPRADIVAGRVYRRMKSLEDARVHFRRAVEKAQFDSDLLYSIANQQYGIGDYSGALWALTKAEQGSPGIVRVGVLKAATLVELRELDKAAEAVAELKEKHGDQASILTVSGDMLMARGARAEAVSEYGAAFETAPSFETARTYFRAMVSVGMVAEATEFMEGWMADHPRHLGARHLFAQMVMLEKDWSKAKSLYEDLQSRGVEDIVLLNNLATCYQRLGDPRALPTAEAAYNIAPSDPRVADTYGWILTENGRVEEGLALLRDAYARASTSPQIRYHIGLALANLGRTQEAKEEVEAALAANGGFSARDEAASLLDKLRSALR